MKRRLIVFLALFFVGIGLAVAQTRVRGNVVDESGEPVIGATIRIKGTSQGTVTDIDGNFTLSAPAGGTLVISHVGYIDEEATVSRNVRVVLKEDSELLDEVVVTAFGTTTKGAFTGSASVMKSDQLEKKQVSNVTNALAGAAAGVQVISSNGQPGTSAAVRVRGVGSINAGANPLYIVDGVPYDGNLTATASSKVQSADVLSSINSADIESITILKDAASTALYGARGANGIILITTKKGKQGKARVSLDAKWGVNSRSVKNYDVMTDPNEYVETAYQALYNAGVYNLNYDAAAANAYANSTIWTNSSGGLGYQIHTVPEGESFIGMDGKINSGATLGFSDGTYYYTPDNWADETFSSNMRQEYNLNIAGGTDNGSYYISFGSLDDQGIISGSGFTRYTGRFNGDYKIKEWLKVGANVNYANTESYYPSEQTSTSSSANAFFIANFIAPIYPMYVRSAEDKQIMYNNGRKVYDYGDGVSTNFSRPFMSISNPVGDLTYDQTVYLSDIFNSSWFAEIKPMKNLVVTAKYGLNINNMRYNLLGNLYMGQSSQSGGTATQAQYRYYGFNQQYIAVYNFSIEDDHKFDLTAGYDGYTYQHTRLEAWGSGLYNPEDYYLGNTIDAPSVYGKNDEYATKGILSRLNYSYKDTYFGNVSYRRDGSSRFAPGKRWGNFWGASAAWMLSNEEFLRTARRINMLKLKASVGQQGNDDIGNYYAWADQYEITGADGIFSDGNLYYKGNPDLTWETSTSYNVGFDFSFFNNTLGGSVEYFGRTSSDMLYNSPVAGSLGYTSIPMNIGSMTNSGVELDLSYNILKTSKVDWSINANATFIKNKINELHPDLGGELIDGSRIYEEGYSMYRMYLVDYAGVDPETGQALYWAEDESGTKIKTADYSTAENYKVATANLMPKVYGGFGTTLSAFGFDASVQLSYQLGGKIYDNGYVRLMHGGTASYAGMNWHTDIRNAWTETNTDTDVPRLDSNDNYANSSSTRFLTNSNYLSLNNITVGYTVPSSLINKLQLSTLRVYVSADNIALLSSRKGLDPRQSYTTATTALYTPMRTVVGGISVSF